MTLMHNFNPYFTNDGSVGLYSDTDNDVYHSTFGALTESYEKFILPANFPKYFQKNNEIKILDLCFGIGYNTKSFLNFLIDFLTIDTIDTDNNKYNDKIYTDNTNCNLERKCLPCQREGNREAVEGFLYKIFIHAVDTDKNLVQLSPFITTKNKNIKNNRLPFHNEKVEKMISGETKPKYKLHEEVNYLLLNALMNTVDAYPPLETLPSPNFQWTFGREVRSKSPISGWGKNHMDDDIKSIIFDKKYSQYFDRIVIDFKPHKNILDYILYPLAILNAFLHNIYYRYISSSHKKVLKALKMLDFNFKVSIDDARTVLKNDKSKYNFVFLDAFTPTKCPCLWSVDFFKLIFEHLEDGGMILTYSNSAQVRHAMLDAGFKIYKNVVDNKSQGTIAVKNNGILRFAQDDATVILRAQPEESHKILPLSQYELGLLHTKAGIYFRDENLSLTNKEIIACHEIEVKNSTLMSATQYKKQNLL